MTLKQRTLPKLSLVVPCSEGESHLQGAELSDQRGRAHTLRGVASAQRVEPGRSARSQKGGARPDGG